VQNPLLARHAAQQDSDQTIVRKSGILSASHFSPSQRDCSYEYYTPASQPQAHIFLLIHPQESPLLIHRCITSAIDAELCIARELVSTITNDVLYRKEYATRLQIRHVSYDAIPCSRHSGYCMMFPD
jgi:hypothetical protein